MKILIENDVTQEYFTALGEWAKLPVGGKNFPATIAAFRVAKRLAIQRFNIVGHISETDQFINLHHGSGLGLVPLAEGVGAVGEPA